MKFRITQTVDGIYHLDRKGWFFWHRVYGFWFSVESAQQAAQRLIFVKEFKI